MQRYFRPLLQLIALCVLLFCAGCKKSKPTNQGTQPLTVIRITGIPDENPTALQRKYAPMVRYLSQALGVKVTYTPVVDYGAAVQALVADKIDFAWLGGFTHVQSRKLGKVVPLVMRGIDRNFQSVFLAHAQSKISTMADLKGKSFAFGSKSSTSGHLMPRHFLQTQYKLDPDKDFKGAPVYSGAHDATVKMIESGKIDAGAVNREVWLRMLRQKQVDPNKVKLVWTTPGYVDYVWTARKAVPQSLRDKFTRAFLSLDHTKPAHRSVLQLQGAKRFVKANTSDFDPIENVARSTGLLKAPPR